MAELPAYKGQVELAMRLTNHLPEWTTLKQELEALLSRMEALYMAIDAHNNHVTLNSI